jgi:ribosomal protein L4
MPKADAGLTKASRNVPNVTPVTASTLGLLEVLRADSLIVLKDSLPVIEKTFLKA